MIPALRILDRKERRQAVRFAVCLTASSVLMTGVLTLVAQALGATPGSESHRTLVITFVIAIVAIYTLLRVGAGGLMAQLQHALASLRVRVTRQIVSAELRAVEEAGEASAAHTQQVEQVSIFFGQGVAFLQMATMLVPGLLYVMLTSLSSAVAVAVTGVLTLPMLAAEFAKSRAATRQMSNDRASFNALLGQMLEGFKQIKLDERTGNAVLADLKERSQRVTEGRLRLDAAMGREVLGSSGFIHLVTALILFVIPSNSTPDPASLFSVALMLYMMVGPVIFFASQTHVLTSANLAYERLVELGGKLRPDPALEAERTEAEGMGAEGTGAEDAEAEHAEAIRAAAARAAAEQVDATPMAFERITLHGVSFTYGKAKEPSFTVGPIDLELRRGEIVFITGGNGSGKTTLMKTLCGLYPPGTGSIQVDERRIGAHDLERYRALFTAIFSDQHLFPKPYGIRAEPDRVRALLKRFGLEHVTRFEDGRFTKLALSSGQAKRLSMVIALLEDRPIFLLDEWAAHQDPELRRYYYTELLPELRAQGKSILAVSHDDQFFGVADRQIALENGQIRAVADGEGLPAGADTPSG
ncbi:ATP-binding cassette domain-containing protein [Chondromyces crocatus]|uniref:ABC transporter ATP-binding protein n=1 Tax=Chondromyces crocatus TaxID=52 RepID=A0A0K1EC07_CHOCO|nr:ATP-binding cassette domain-containing protein [Chondromyces crocatus]AKT38405.1 uncharacterized protein CMC5_025510 [Chondromyces crocatus]